MRFLPRIVVPAMDTSPSRPARSPRAPAAVRAALALAALLVLALALAPRAGAAVYWSNPAQPFATPPVSGSIGHANLDGTGINQAFIADVSGPCGVASDGTHLYWSTGQSIGRANVDGTGVNQNFLPGVSSCALAVDAAHIYWDTRDGSIGRANLDGTAVNASFIPTVGAVFGVAVDGAHVYWSTFNSVGRANLDGTGANQNLILFDADDLPCGVAVDAGHLYWANALGTIGRANLNGTAPDPNFVQARPQVDSLTCGVAVDSAHLYWYHSALDTQEAAGDGIGRANLDGTGVNLAFITTPDPRAIAVDSATHAVQPSRVAIGDVRMAEGDAGQTAFRFTASLDQAQSAPVTVDFATADGTATAPSDYAANTGTVTFAAGETAKTVTVQVNGDTRKESNETFRVNLSHPTGNATIADGQGVGTIVNDDRRHPSHGFTLGTARLNPDAGTARLAVRVPGPGTLASFDSGAQAARAGKARSVRAAGTVRLLIRASGAKQRTLDRTGTVIVSSRVTYTPIGGRPHMRSKTIRLRKR